MAQVDPAGFQEFENEWFRVTHALADSDHELADALLDYRGQAVDFDAARISQALAQRDQAKEVVDSLMHIIWKKLF